MMLNKDFCQKNIMLLQLTKGHHFSFALTFFISNLFITINILNVKHFNECILISHLYISKKYFSIICPSTKSTNIEFFLQANLPYKKNLSGHKPNNVSLTSYASRTVHKPYNFAWKEAIWRHNLSETSKKPENLPEILQFSTDMNQIMFLWRHTLQDFSRKPSKFNIDIDQMKTL